MLAISEQRAAGKIKEAVYFNERAVDAIFDCNCDPKKRSESLKRYNVL